MLHQPILVGQVEEGDEKENAAGQEIRLEAKEAAKVVEHLLDGELIVDGHLLGHVPHRGPGNLAARLVGLVAEDAHLPLLRFDPTDDAPKQSGLA